MANDDWWRQRARKMALRTIALAPRINAHQNGFVGIIQSTPDTGNFMTVISNLVSPASRTLPKFAFRSEPILIFLQGVP